MSLSEPGKVPDGGWAHGVLEPRAARYHLPVVLLCTVVWVLLLLGQLRWIHLPFSWGAQDGVFVICSLVAVGVGLGCQVPLQNIVGATVLIGGLGLLIEILNARTGFPFGRLLYTDGFSGPRLGGVPWILPLFWVMAVIWARGFARVLLVNRRHHTWYGYVLLLAAAGLVVLMDFEWQRLAGRAHGHWLWRVDPEILRWRGVPWTRCAGVYGTAVVLLFVAFPWFVNKKPVPTPLDRAGVWILWMWIIHAALADGVTGAWFAAVIELGVGLWGVWATWVARPCNPSNPPYGGDGLGRVENRSLRKQGEESPNSTGRDAV